MTSKNIIERLKQQDWYVKCETEHELALVLNACLDSGLHWASGDKASFIPESMLNEISVFIVRGTIWDKKGICWGDNSEYFQTDSSDCEDITDWFFEELRNEMEKLTPQNEHEEHMVHILLAKMQGVTVEYKRGTDWCPAAPGSLSFNTEYRIVPQTPLPITRNMWRMISEKWKWAAMDKNGKVYFYEDEPCIGINGISWTNCSGDYCGCALATNTDDINWRLSLTKRPKDV